MNLRSGTTLWQAVSSEPLESPALSSDTCCEIVVLGGGITGALAAHQLVNEGHDVVLIDRGEFGTGSTAASTGLLQYEVDTPLVDLIEEVGEDQAVQAYRRGLAAIDAIETMLIQLGDSCGFRRRESLYFASNIWHYRKLKREFECRRKFGFDVTFLSRQELREKSTIRASGAILSRGDAEIDPLRFTRRLIAASVRMGLRAFANTPVVEIREAENGVFLQTAGATVLAEHIVYATGYESEEHLDTAKGSLDSTYAVASEPGLAVPGWPDQCLIWETARPYFYARATEDGRAILGGGDTEFSNDHDRDQLVERQVKRLLARFKELFPNAQFTPEYAWAGTFAGTKDGLPFIGRPQHRPRALFALGYGGNGITFSVIAAKLIADLLAHRMNSDAQVFAFNR